MLAEISNSLQRGNSMSVQLVINRNRGLYPMRSSSLPSQKHPAYRKKAPPTAHSFGITDLDTAIEQQKR